MILQKKPTIQRNNTVLHPPTRIAAPEAEGTLSVSQNARTRAGAPLPPWNGSGMTATVAPTLGMRSRLFMFSTQYKPLDVRATCATNAGALPEKESQVYDYTPLWVISLTFFY